MCQSDRIDLALNETTIALFNTFLRAHIIFDLPRWHKSDLLSASEIIHILTILKNVLFLFHKLFKLILHQLTL